jgi:hypothetical protein
VKLLAVLVDYSCSTLSFFYKRYLQCGSNLYVHDQVDYVTASLHSFSQLALRRCPSMSHNCFEVLRDIRTIIITW